MDSNKYFLMWWCFFFGLGILLTCLITPSTEFLKYNQDIPIDEIVSNMSYLVNTTCERYKCSDFDVCKNCLGIYNDNIYDNNTYKDLFYNINKTILYNDDNNLINLMEKNFPYQSGICITSDMNYSICCSDCEETANRILKWVIGISIILLIYIILCMFCYNKKINDRKINNIIV